MISKIIKQKSFNDQDLTCKMKEIKKLLSLSFDDIQIIEVFTANWNIGESKEIEGTLNELLIKTENHVRFKTTIPPKRSFNPHWHNWDERCSIFEGELKDRVYQPDKTWNKFKPYFIPKLTKHQPFNPSEIRDTIIIVDFIND